MRNKNRLTEVVVRAADGLSGATLNALVVGKHIDTASRVITKSCRQLQ